jgi:cytochrome P450
LSALVRLLLIAGFETTVNAIGSGMRWLLADREQWETLVADPSRAPAVAEEVLRFDPPVQLTARVAHQPVQVGEVLVARNQLVITLLAAAIVTPMSIPNPTVSTSCGSPLPSIWPSRAAFIIASARRSPGWS